MSNLYRRKGHMPAGRSARRTKRLWSRLVYHFESPPVVAANEAMWDLMLQSGLVLEKPSTGKDGNVITFASVSKLAYGIRENEIVSNGDKL